MPSSSAPGDYKTDAAALKNGSSDWGAALEEFLQLLARAVRQFHTYPATSPMCADAINTCHKAFAALDRHDRLALRITPHEIVAGDVHDIHIGAGTIVETEIIRRLHRAHVAALEIDRAASPRDLAHFCTDVIRCDDLAQTKTTFAELLTEHGVESIVPRMAHRPEVLDVGARPAHIWDLVEHDRTRRNATLPAGPVQYLYPPEKGWVRLQSGATNETVSLVDLAVLVDDPADIATMLLRLTDDDPVDDIGRKRALEQKFSDVAMLFAALDGHLARVMFAKLARAILAIEPDRRKTLLRHTILPGLLDGRAAGAVLRDLPDPDLAESLCLLLELETAAPEVVTAALERLDLPAERRQTIASLVEERLRASLAPHDLESGGREHKIDRFASRLLRIDAAVKKDFTELAAFDLSIDDQTAVALEAVGPAIAATDLAAEQIACLWRLVRLEPNPALVDAFMSRTTRLLGDLDRVGRHRDVAAVSLRYRELADTLRENRPDVADAIVSALTRFCTPARALQIVERGTNDRTLTELTIAALGDALAPSLVALLDESALPSTASSGVRAGSVIAFVCEHASALVPGLVAELGRSGIAATRAITRACGHAGRGYEAVVSGQLTSGDEQTVREAVRALARIGTARAAALVSAQIQNGGPVARAAAEEALWHFPPAQTAMLLREILGHRQFVVHNPVTVSRLIERAAQARAGGLDPVLAELETLRFRFWQPRLARVAWKARELRTR